MSAHPGRARVLGDSGWQGGGECRPVMTDPAPATDLICILIVDDERAIAACR